MGAPILSSFSLTHERGRESDASTYLERAPRYDGAPDGQAGGRALPFELLLFLYSYIHTVAWQYAFVKIK